MCIWPSRAQNRGLQTWVCSRYLLTSVVTVAESCAECERFASTSRANKACAKCLWLLGSAGCARCVVQARGRYSPQPGQCRACKHLLAHMIMNTLGHGARAHRWCTHSSHCARHGLNRKCGAQLRASRPPRAILACRVLGDKRVSAWTPRSTERRFCAWLALCAPQR